MTLIIPRGGGGHHVVRREMVNYIHLVQNWDKSEADVKAEMKFLVL
jgi:hypothetical protein